jgi:hypothetical protein
MTPRAVLASATAVLVLLGLSPRAGAETEFSLSAGYAHVSLDDTSIGEFAEQGGLRFEPRFSFAPWEQRPQLRVGLAMGFSGFYDETDGTATFIDDDGDVIFADADDYEQLFLWTPEVQLSWRERWGDGWMIEGGVGVGAVIGFYSAGEQFFDEFYDEDLSESDLTWSARPFVRTGYDNGRLTVGLEASYLWGGSLEFTDEIGGDVQEWYVGVFFSLSR